MLADIFCFCRNVQSQVIEKTTNKVIPSGLQPSNSLRKETKVSPQTSSVRVHGVEISSKNFGAKPAAHSVVVSANMRKMHILVVDDSAPLTKVMATVLKMRGHDVDCVYNGEDAMAKMTEKEYDLVVIDEHMPVMGGIEAVSSFRRYEKSAIAAGLRRFPQLIIGMTSDLSAPEEYRAAGTDDVLRKPFTISELLNRAIVIGIHASNTTNLPPPDESSSFTMRTPAAVVSDIAKRKSRGYQTAPSATVISSSLLEELPPSASVLSIVGNGTR